MTKNVSFIAAFQGNYKSFGDVVHKRFRLVYTHSISLSSSWPFPIDSVRQIFFTTSILGAFAKLRKATIIFVMFLCPSVQKEQLG
jgi:hypothetical protein